MCNNFQVNMQYMLDQLHVSSKMLKPVLLICFHIQTSLSLTTNKLIYQGTSIHLHIYIRVTFFLSLIVPFMKLGQLIGLNMHFTIVWIRNKTRTRKRTRQLFGITERTEKYRAFLNYSVIKKTVFYERAYSLVSDMLLLCKISLPSGNSWIYTYIN